MEDYKFYRISEERLNDLKSLYIASFKKTYSLTYLKKKFNTFFTGVAYIGYIAYDKNDLPAAYYGVFPCHISISGKIIIAAQSGDTMTHPLHQGKGLFTKLAKLTYELAKNSGVKFIFGFPNKNSYPGFIKKLNWKDKGPLELYSIKVNTIPISSIIQFFKIKSLYIRVISKFLFNRTKSNVAINSIIHQGFDGIDRSEDFLNYKKYETNFFAKINDKHLWLKIDHRLIIGDLEPMTSEEFNSVIKKIRVRAFLSGIRRIIFISSPETFYSREFSNLPGIVHSNTIHDCYLGEHAAEIDPKKIKFTGADWDSF